MDSVNDLPNTCASANLEPTGFNIVGLHSAFVSKLRFGNSKPTVSKINRFVCHAWPAARFTMVNAMVNALDQAMANINIIAMVIALVGAFVGSLVGVNSLRWLF